MRNQLFTSSPKTKPTVRNAAGGRAYDPGAEHGLAQMALTSTLADSYYTSAEAQLEAVIKLADQCAPEFIGQLAVYARAKGMKDLPAVLVAYLAGKYENTVLDSVFARVIDNGRMARNFVQMLRSGRFGRRGLGSQPKRLLRQWFASNGAEGVYRNSTGTNPSMADVIKLARPVPLNDAEKEMYRYLIGKGEPAGLAWQLRAWAAGSADIPLGLPFEFYAGVAKTREHWDSVARILSWNGTLKSLNTFARHGISEGAWDAVEDRLKNGRIPVSVFPYNVMQAYLQVQTNSAIPMRVRLAVQDALDRSLDNVPALDGTVAVLVDSSGSMGSPVTGHRGSATGATTCIQAAALIACAILRKNPGATLITFDTTADLVNLNPRDSVATNSRLFPNKGGGTDVGCGLAKLLSVGKAPDTTIIVSDNESWYTPPELYHNRWVNRTTADAHFTTMRKRNKNAKLACINLTANPTVQVLDDKRVVNLGGFSDAVFTTVADFSRGTLSPEHWVGEIKAIEL